ncbi:N-acetyltransferase family protein [Sphingomonas oryzagri]
MAEQAVHRTTRSGFGLDVRPAMESDEAILAQFFEHVTPEDLRFRYLSTVPRVSPAQLHAMTHVDHRGTDSFLAFDDEGALVATAVLGCDASLRHGEVAIVVRADHKARGIGWELLHHVAEIAADRGVETIESIESRENHAAIEVERDSGFVAHAVDDDPTVVRVVKSLCAGAAGRA